MYMTNDWIEFKENGYELRRRNPRVLLTKDKLFRLNRKAMELLGEPAAVKFLFDVTRNRIGIQAETPDARHSFPIRRRDKGRSAIVHGALFCNRFGIKPESTIEFDSVGLDSRGILILDLGTAMSRAR